MSHTLATLVTYLPMAATAEPTGGIDSQGIYTWVIKNIIPLILLLIGLGIIWGSKKGDFSKVANTVIIVVIGLVVIGGTVALRGFADQIAGVVFK